MLKFVRIFFTNFEICAFFVVESDGNFVNNKYYLRMKFMFLQDFMKNSINGTTESQKLITADKN